MSGWFPDTCRCVLEYLPQSGTDVYTIVQAGPEHATANASVVLDENGRKNQMQGIVTNLVTGLDPKAFTWSFNLARTLLISFQGTNIPNQVKAQLQNAADLQYGPGKVVVS